MRKLILKWLFGIENVDKYIKLLSNYEKLGDKYICEIKQHRDQIEAHIKTLEEFSNTLDDVKKLIKICQNYGIDVDKEIKEVKL